MPVVTIKYKKPETLKILKGLAEYFDFEIDTSSEEESLASVLGSAVKSNEITVNGVTMIPGDPSIDISELRKLFTEKNLDAKKLREEAWRRPR